METHFPTSCQSKTL